MTNKNKQTKLQLNLLKDIEETNIRLKVKQDPEYALSMLCAYRPEATLRQINNSLPRDNQS